MKLLISTRLTFVFLIALLLISGCTVKYVAEYDAEIKNEIIQVAKKVDLFWGDLLDTDVDKRQYDKFKTNYNEIESDIRSLVLKNEIRPLNEESTEQAKIALKLWTDDREKHKSDDGFSNGRAKLHQRQLSRVFAAMAKGEAVKDPSN
ncbi:hypothetical protein FLL45_04655 [Aliikangiella marina]|uniref:Uncharacterized protein n=1 Tax=Aliikangiella marina TaxID=1712262 RepID=A0A545TJ99_9GAMM|nr:hypothetical protein [Aliikangiella marina]TQV77241.1 hypothetical protein FLL45_04655 [Aliikangiella marina]